MTSKDFLYNYHNANAPVGAEVEGQKVWLDYLKPYIDSYQIDNYGSVVGIINPEAPYKVVLEAHADEISWFVNYITDDGYIYVIRNGGSDFAIAPSMRADIHTPKGIVKGVFGWPAIHVRNAKDEIKPEQKNIFVDVGASTKDEVLALGIHVGTMITFEGSFMELNKKYYTGRALDNRMGGYCIAEVARRLKEDKVKLDFGLYITNSVQEEVGLHGAEMIVQSIKPDMAICIDVCHDTFSPLGYNKIEEGAVKAGLGPAISYAPAVHRILRDRLISVAEAEEIPYQRLASSRATGTDTDAFAYSNGGVPSILASIPLKYMHTTVETVSQDDVESLIKLLYAYLKTLNPSQNLKYFS